MTINTAILTAEELETITKIVETAKQREAATKSQNSVSSDSNWCVFVTGPVCQVDFYRSYTVLSGFQDAILSQLGSMSNRIDNLEAEGSGRTGPEPAATSVAIQPIQSTVLVHVADAYAASSAEFRSWTDPPGPTTDSGDGSASCNGPHASSLRQRWRHFERHGESGLRFCLYGLFCITVLCSHSTRRLCRTLLARVSRLSCPNLGLPNQTSSRRRSWVRSSPRSESARSRTRPKSLFADQHAKRTGLWLSNVGKIM